MEISIYSKDGTKYKGVCDSYLLNEDKQSITLYKHKKSSPQYASIKTPIAYFRLTELVGIYFYED